MNFEGMFLTIIFISLRLVVFVGVRENDARGLKMSTNESKSSKGGVIIFLIGSDSSIGVQTS